MSESVASLAEAIARRAHAGQFRRDGVTPYILHPASVVARVGTDESAQAVAWLHDVLEDTGETADSLRAQGVPENVIEAVSLLTHAASVEYAKYLGAVRVHPLARKVKIADMLANLSDHPTERQIVKYSKGLLFLHQEIEL